MSTMITKEAMINVSTIIRMRAGRTFLSIETKSAENAVVNINPSDITNVFLTALVTARAEQIPRI
jgi:hypothetical protein